jgi:hypothetical protein
VRSQSCGPKELAKVVFTELETRGVACPAETQLSTLFEAMFYASLKTEETHQTTLSVTYINPTNPDPKPPRLIKRDRWALVPFLEPVPFNVRNLVKLSVASDPRSSSFAIYPDEAGDLQVWGLIDQQNNHHEFVNYNAESGHQPPGLFQATALSLGHLRVSVGYENIAELKVDTLVSRKPDVLRKGPVAEKLEIGINHYIESVVRAASECGAVSSWAGMFADRWISSLCRLLLRIQSYRHGGALLITPDTAFQYLNIKHGIDYTRLRDGLRARAVLSCEKCDADDLIFEEYIEPSADEMPVGLYLDSVIAEGEVEDARSELNGAIWFISLLSRVDGLILMDPGLKIYGFGAEITVSEEPTEIYISSDASGARASLRDCPYTHFGTRHRSMMRYCHAVPEAVGFVISQDGDVRAMTKVNKHLVMWEDIKLQLEITRSKRRRSLKRVAAQRQTAVVDPGVSK